MRARQRHLNPLHAGAVRAYDTRFVSGGVNNTSLQTWTDRCLTANATQSDASFRPTFISNGQGGSPVLRFDGSNDAYTFTTASTTSNVTAMTAHKISVIGGIVLSGSGNTQILRVVNSSGNRSLFFNLNVDNTQYLSAQTVDWTTFGVATVTAPGGSPTRNFRNGVDFGNSTQNANLTSCSWGKIGSAFAGGSFANMDIGLLSILPINIADSPLRKRLEHAAAFSFKFACS